MFTPDNTRKLELWNSILATYYTHQEFYSIIFSAKNKPQKNGRRFISYGTDYLAWMLSNVSVQVLWDKFIELVFDDKSPQELCSKFNMSCCGSDCHDSQCNEKWQCLKEYLLYKVYTEIGVERLARPMPQAAR
jgi:hypothetical protein